MRNLAVRAGKWIYRHTPWAPLRRAEFAAFYRVVRHRSVVTRVGTLTYALDLGELIDLQLYLGQYEPEVTAALARHCPRGGVVLDIGANVGAHTLRLGELTGPEGKVIAFEPTQYAYDKLIRNISLNNHMTHIQAVRAALSDRNGEESCELRATWRPDGRHSSYRTVVEFVRLDDWCARAGVERIDLVKLDVDGPEAAILAGGEQVIRRTRPVFVMEVGAYHFAEGAACPPAMLREWGYELFELSGDAPLALDELRRRCATIDSVNVVARPRTA